MKLCCFFNYAPLYRQSIYEAIDKEFDVQFYFGREVEEGKKSGIPKIDYNTFRRYPIEFKNKKLFNHFLWRTKCALLPLKKYDTFIITGDFVYSYIPFLLICCLLRKKVFGWGHGIKTRKGKGHIFNDFMYKMLAGFLSYSEGGKKRLTELGIPEKKIHPIYNSLDKSSLGNQSLKDDIYVNKFHNNNHTLIFVGRLTPQKQLDWLLKAIKSLKDKGKKCNLVIVGDGPCRDELENKTKKLGIEDLLWFYGECYDESTNGKLLYNADLCVSPGNVGLTALNAMQYGTPVVSHNDFETQMPEYETIIEGETGSLYEKGNLTDFIHTIEKWLDEKATNREEIRKNCLAMINGKWNSDNQIQIIKQVLTEL